MRRGFRRAAVSQAARSRTLTKTFPPPVRGWIRNENLAASGPVGAYQLDNWFPTQDGIRLRGGSRKYATVSTGACTSLFSYIVGTTETFFAADANNIFDITTIADADVIPSAAVSSQTSGYYSTVQMGTTGGDFLYAVNGDDSALLYDGTDFYAIDANDIVDIAYDAETGNFTAGLVLTGGTSSATGTILSVTDAGTTGTLRVRETSGTFQDNETITDTSTGSATSNIPSGPVAVYNGITGVTTSNLSFVWVFANRLFFVEKGTMNAWYLSVSSISGTATRFSLNGIFKNGGELLFGGTWSLDSGDGLDDKCVFVSSTGEVAVYEGTDPSSSTTWAKAGVYDITPPMGFNATLKAGGDLVIATEEGMVPISEAVTRDSAALSLAAITRAIEPEWTSEVNARRSKSWDILKWPSNNMAVVALPVVDATTEAYCYVVNLETGAWCRYTGWDTECLGLYNSIGYFGTSGGKVMQMEASGSDDGATYTAVYAGLFDHLNAPAASKTITTARTIMNAGTDIIPQVSISNDYAINLPSPPNSIADYTSDEWDVGLWDVAIFDAGVQLETKTQWHSIGQSGFAVAPQLQLTMGVSPTPKVELVAIDLMYEIGGVMV